MRLNLIIDRFALISGLEPEEVSGWTPLCIDAKKQIERAVKGTLEEDEETEIRLSNCAAALAFYKYSLYAPRDNVESFSAGALNVKLSRNDKERAENIWNLERKSCEDILSFGEEFSFVGVVV